MQSESHWVPPSPHCERKLSRRARRNWKKNMLHAALRSGKYLYYFLSSFSHSQFSSCTWTDDSEWSQNQRHCVNISNSFRIHIVLEFWLNCILYRGGERIMKAQQSPVTRVNENVKNYRYHHWLCHGWHRLRIHLARTKHCKQQHNICTHFLGRLECHFLLINIRTRVGHLSLPSDCPQSIHLIKGRRIVRVASSMAPFTFFFPPLLNIVLRWNL